MSVIKSFLYLDEYKMYSISSQIFEGLTEYLMDIHEKTTKEKEAQSGPFGSGRAMAHILESEYRTEEKKYLHDYSYTLFERHLQEGNKVNYLSDKTICDALENMGYSDFVEIRGTAAFNDMNKIKSTISSFNDIGEALAYLTNHGKLEEMRQRFEEIKNSKSDRNEKARLTQQLKALSNLKNLATASGLRMDPTFIEKLGLILNYGFQDQFEIRMTLGDYTFSANLKREYLRENENLLVRKYSRFPETPLVLFGTIAQSAGSQLDENGENEPEEDGVDHMKVVVMRMVEALSKVEDTFSGKLANEIIIDPIALYREI